MASANDNPYLAHHYSARKDAGSGYKMGVAAAKEPLFGFMPRKVKGEQVRQAMVR
jgi:pre-mRNA-splicing factor ATP-dependent RNA helicase DHX15/PRP43